MPAVFLSQSEAVLALRTEMVDDKRIITRPWAKIFQTLFGTQIQSFLSGSNGARQGVPASNYADGSLFFETDRRVFYIAIGGQWKYLTGCAQFLSGGLPIGLGANDIGLLVDVTDFTHQLVWDGTGWQWAPGELGSDFVVAFASGPVPALGWHACDGSANVLKLSFDGSLSFVTVPNIPGSFYRQ